MFKFLGKILIKYDLFVGFVLGKYYSNKYNAHVKFVRQGFGRFEISGNGMFNIGINSRLKSNTYIEVTGGVTIGKYVHFGRGLTIFSSNHDYNGSYIPYDEKDILKAVVIEDFVWLGSNVTVLPGCYIEEGVVVGAGSVVSGRLDKGGIYAGCPARLIKYRNLNMYEVNKLSGKFH